MGGVLLCTACPPEIPGHGFHAPSDNWKLNIETGGRSYRLVNDTSLTVRADIGEDFVLSMIVNMNLNLYY